MITVQNFRKALVAMGFSENNGYFEKEYLAFGCKMQVDFSAKKLIFPDAIKGRERNDGFNQNENFVVFECVNRLLEKGYRPEHIELEKEWHLGHDAKSGRADICVSDTDGSMLFIVECKTWGREFDKALNNTKNDGAQLFSYWQQEQSCQWLVLYASDCKDGEIEYKAPTIDCSDDANIVLLSKKDKSIKLYRDAHTASEKHIAWKETYASQIHDNLIFSDDCVAYQIGVKPLCKKDLHDFTPEDKIVNKFEEILRHNNVSDKENAFNRLVALFICKLVDEITKSEDDEVEFQYKQGTDTYETLQDRLQRLHKDGMEQFMREEIYYVSANYPEWLFSTYTGSKRKKAIEDLQRTIRILKFYSNNDFAFKDVHNEELFYQNGKILVEMVQLFEKYRIVYLSKHQFLGDLFEQLLNKGFKQNEGQFFTPIPITRFIWDSLPVDRMVKSDRGTVYPKVIDYACGAGHFLTEAVEAINTFVDNNGDNSWVQDHIYGIEKDYRLARVAKISLFMNGAGKGNIIFGDGLENAPDKGIENGTFDILVANPPYSVKDFKQHLQLKNNNFTLLDRIGLNGGEIETLFVERIAQLLKPQGIAAVILPFPLLSKDSPTSYTGAREEILRNFLIRAVVHLGDKTFNATGQETVIMFLEKYNEPPKKWDLITDSIDAILSAEDVSEWDDKDIYDSYLSVIDVSDEEYTIFIKEEYSLKELAESRYFKSYVDEFLSTPDYKKLSSSKSFSKKTQEDQEAIIQQRLYGFIKTIEREKLRYYAITYQQQTLVILSPSTVDEQTEFLGYKWSNAKGREGIKIINPGGKLFDNNDRLSESTLSSLIRHAFLDDALDISENNAQYAGVIETYDMMDYSRPSFNKALKLFAKRIPDYQSKYPLLTLGSLSDDPQYGANEPAVKGDPNTDYRFIRITDISNDGYLQDDWMTAESIDEQYILHEGDMLFARTGATAGKFFLYEERFGKAIFAGYLIRFHFHEEAVLPAYVKNILCLHHYSEWAAFNRRGRNINAKQFAQFRIPVPPIPIQEQLITECSIIERDSNALHAFVKESKNKIEIILSEVKSAKAKESMTLSDKEYFNISIGNRVLNSELVSDASVPVYSANVKEPFGYVDMLLIDDFSVDSILWGIDGDWMVSYMPKEMPFYPTDHCGVLRILTDKVNPRYMARILEEEGSKMGFSRSYRASKDRVEGISFSVPDIELQNKAMEEVLQLEKQIKDAEESLKALSKKRMDIVQRYIM